MIPKNVAHYEIVEKIGAGGMGEVYRARDPNLAREVAIKVLPPALTENTDRLGRFEQEARAAGTLNHPNLVTIHELGTYKGSPYIVMELVEGQTLREKLGNTAPASSSGAGREGGVEGPTPTPSVAILPVRKALEYATQLARGLGAAHDKGITHRDLKPENILIANDGRVKILDFGLAKLTEPMTDGKTLPTGRSRDTEPGTVLGTVGYMSPEQVRGEKVDHRSDIFSLGVILYEMLSGKRAFYRDTSVQTMNAILTEDPPGLAVDGSRVSPPIDRVVRRCLEKQKEERFQSGHDLAYALEAVGDSSTALPSVATAGSPGRRALPVILGVAAVALVAAGYLAGRGLAPPPSPTPEVPVDRTPRLIPLTFEQGEEIQPSIAPDGKSFVFVSHKSGNFDIYFQRVGGENAINLTADSESRDIQPAFSPDGERIAFRSDRDDGGIYVMGATGESVRRLTDFGFNPAWSPDGKELAVCGESVFGPFGRTTISNLWRVNVATGDTTLVTQGDAVQPNWSPSGKWIAYWGLPQGTGKRTLYTISTGGGDPVPLTDDRFMNWNPVWSSDEQFLYFSSTRGGTMDLWRLPMDPSTARATGAPEPATISAESSAWLSVSRDGSRIVYASSRGTQTLSRYPFDPRNIQLTGEPERIVRSSRFLGLQEISPDGEWILLTVSDPDEDIMICRSDGTGMRRLTNDPFKDRGPAWSWDGNTIVFFSDRTDRYEIWSIRPDGSGLTQLTETSGENVYTPAVSPNGRLIVAQSSLSGAVTSALFDLDGGLPVRDPEWLPPIDSTSTFVAREFAADGRRILGAGYPGREVTVFDLDIREYRTFPETRPGDWLPDGRTVIYPRDDEVFRVDTESGEIQKLYDMPEDLITGTTTFSWDFEWLYHMRSETESDIWMLDYGEESGS